LYAFLARLAKTYTPAPRFHEMIGEKTVSNTKQIARQKKERSIPLGAPPVIDLYTAMIF
jgi:hypothetical protein